MSEYQYEYWLGILMIIFIAIIAYLENKNSKKTSLMYGIAYFITLQRTLFLYKYVLEIINSRKENKLTSKEIVKVLQTEGLKQLIFERETKECWEFHFCNGYYKEFKYTDSAYVLVNYFSDEIKSIEQELKVIWKDKKTLFTSYLTFEPLPFDPDNHFFPPCIIEKISTIFKNNK